MPLINPGMLDEDLEDRPVPAGQYDLRISSVKVKQAKSGRTMIACGMTIEGQADAATVFHNINIPTDDDEPRAKRMMTRDFKRFMHVFNVPYGGADLDEESAADTLSGLTGSCYLMQEEVQDANGNKTGDMRNVLRLPKLAD